MEYHQRAIQLDPNFAMGYRQLGAEYDTLGELGRAREYFSKAFELRDHTCEHKRLSVTRNVGCRCIAQLLQGNTILSHPLVKLGKVTSKMMSRNLLHGLCGK